MVPGWMQLALVVLLAVVLFGGRGKISAIMGDLAKGITSFRKGLKDDADSETAANPVAEPPAGVSDGRTIDGETVSATQSADAGDKT